MGFIQEFKEFAVKGNAIDMAVGIVVGAAFGKIVTSLVNDVIMPPLGFLLGSTDFSSLAVTLKEAREAVKDAAGNVAAAAVPAVQLRYGAFINTVLDFLIVAFAIFIAIKGLNALRRMPTSAGALLHLGRPGRPEAKE